jgi:hypothetical protein
VAFAPDGETLVSAGDDGRIIEWSTESGVILRGGGQRVRPMPPVPGVRSDEASRVDLLGMADDVRTLATLVAATGTDPPLAIALLGEWGSGKSSVMLQVHDAVEQLTALSRSHPGGSLYAGNLLQVRFNAWHYSDDKVWTGLVDHLFRTLAAASDSDRPPPAPAEIDEARDRLRRECDTQRSHCDELDNSRGNRPASRARTLWRARWSLLTGVVDVALAVALGMLVHAFGVLVQWLSGVAAGALGIAAVWLVNQKRPAQPVREWFDGTLDEQIQQARSRLAELEVRLAQVDAAAQLAQLLRQYTDTDPYAGSRGLLGQVHRDLEQLGTTLQRQREERRVSGLTGEPPLERIVLYIDDLDRCPPARVVEVLAAVHLMLALPLFVVVVAVDPRWLLGALRHHYRELFAADTGAGGQLATPLDYLDKIFQIPFTVRTPSPLDTARFLTTLLGHAPADRPPAAGGPGGLQAEGRSAGAGTVPPAPGARPTFARSAADSRRPAGAPDISADRPSPPSSAHEAVPDLRPGGLVLRDIEAESMVRLGPLLTTPRAAKKLVNLYRLVRIGIPETELPAFVGSGGYRVVQILLAILVGAPDDASALFAAIRDAAHDATIVETLRDASHAADATVSGRRARIVEVIEDILTTAPEAATGIGTYQLWCPTLARYSFHTRSA